MSHRRISLLLFGIVAVSTAPARAEETEAGHGFGLGYKLGNGLGPFGIDAIGRPLPHLTLDLQTSYVSNSSAVGSAWGFGVAPMVAVEWKTQGHSPYLGAGFIYKYERLSGNGSSATGFFVNTGVQLRFASGLGLIGGIGVNHLGSGLEGLDGNFFNVTDAGWHFNLEAGARYFF